MSDVHSVDFLLLMQRSLERMKTPQHSRASHAVFITLELFPKILILTVFGVFKDPKDLTSFKIMNMERNDGILSSGVFKHPKNGLRVNSPFAPLTSTCDVTTASHTESTQTDGHYQTYYLPCFLVDKYVFYLFSNISAGALP